MNFLIIHGVYANSNENWFPWIKKELESRGYDVIIPNFPTPINQSLENWINVLKKYEDKINKDTVLIGHSLGAVFILDYLELTKKKIKCAFLISGFFTPLNSPYEKMNKTFVDKKFNWGKIRENCKKFYVFGSDNDEYISVDIFNDLAKNLGETPIIIKNAGHFNKSCGFYKFPQLIDVMVKEGIL